MNSPLEVNDRHLTNLFILVMQSGDLCSRFLTPSVSDQRPRGRRAGSLYSPRSTHQRNDSWSLDDKLQHSSSDISITLDRTVNPHSFDATTRSQSFEGSSRRSAWFEEFNRTSTLKTRYWIVSSTLKGIWPIPGTLPNNVFSYQSTFFPYRPQYHKAL